MSLISLKEMLQEARAKHYAVPMFDVSSDAMIRLAVEVAQEERSPILLGAIQPDIDGSRLAYWVECCKIGAKQVDIPVCIHLDHATTFEQCVRCAEAGFTGVMIDASICDFDENVRRTKEVCDAMKKYGISVEAELGHVGDGIAGGGEAALTGHSDEGSLTEPQKVVEFIERTNVDALAVAIGTAHGVYVKAPKLDIERLAEINKISSVPLVLHGGSGTPEDQLRNAIKHGVAKINIYSEIMHAWNATMLKTLSESKNLSCWLSVANAPSEKALKEAMRAKIRLFGSNNQI